MHDVAHDCFSKEENLAVSMTQSVLSFYYLLVD